MALAGALLALAGCGSSGPPREAFARQADAICAPALGKLRELDASLAVAGADPEPDAVYAKSAALLRERVAVSRGAFDRIEALEEPAEGADAIDAWVAASRRQAVVTEELAAAYAAQDQTRIARLSERADELEERNSATAAGLGLGRCAERVRD